MQNTTVPPIPLPARPQHRHTPAHHPRTPPPHITSPHTAASAPGTPTEITAHERAPAHQQSALAPSP